MENDPLYPMSLILLSVSVYTFFQTSTFWRREKQIWEKFQSHVWTLLCSPKGALNEIMTWDTLKMETLVNQAL